MKNFFAAIKRAPKRTASIAIVAAAVIAPAALFAWGPDRPAFTVAEPADYVTFNSIVDNPNYGNERNFITAKDPATGNFTDELTVQPGKEYEVRILVHNNANANLDLKAVNAQVKAVVSQKTSKRNAITSYVSADNAEPQKIHDDVFFKSDKDFNLAYVAGSARVYNNGYAAGGQGKAFSDSLVTSAGAKLGYAAEGDGIIPGCFEYINYVYFKIKPQFAPKADFAVQKKVSETGKNSWKDSLNVVAEQTIDYRVEYKNTGTAQQDNVVIKDQLPADVDYIAGSSKLYNTQNPKGKTLSDGIVSSKGVNIGSHAAGANSFVVFQAKVAANDELDECGINTLTNKATVETDHGKKSDTANVVVTKECEDTPPVTPEEPPVTPETPEKPPVTPEVPAELPKTGIDSVLGLLGLGSIATAAGYYFTSRRQ